MLKNPLRETFCIMWFMYVFKIDFHVYLMDYRLFSSDNVLGSFFVFFMVFGFKNFGFRGSGVCSVWRLRRFKVFFRVRVASGLAC